MNKPGLNALPLGLALACAGVLGWIWLQRPGPRDKTAARSAGAARGLDSSSNGAAAGKAASASDAEALIASLTRMLARADVRAREALLSFKDEAAFRRFFERAGSSGLTVLGRLDGLRSVRVRYDRLAALQNELRQNAADYVAVGANPLVNLPRAPAKEDRAAVDQVPFGNETLAFLGAAGDRSNWGRGTTIAILDTGLAPDSTFGPNRIQYLDVGLGSVPGRGSEDGHGTAVAALAGGAATDAPGVAPATNLLSIRVTDASGTSDLFTIAQAIVAAVDAGARIVNISLGGYGTNATLDAAIAYAGDRGAVIVAAAGNDQAAQLAWPAANLSVISVGAVDRAEQQVAFSNSGPQLKLSAPGYGVQTAWLDGTRAYVDGTSASAPLVAGAIAALISQSPGLSPQDAAQLLMRSASDAGAPGADAAFGAGILNLGWAMNSSTPGYIDTAVSSHYFDAATNQMQFVVQNRSSQAVAGLNLNVTAGADATDYPIPSLAAGESYVVKVPVDDATLKAAGTLRFTTQLANPAGFTDRVPGNNRKASVLTPPGRP